MADYDHGSGNDRFEYDVWVDGVWLGWPSNFEKVCLTWFPLAVRERRRKGDMRKTAMQTVSACCLVLLIIGAAALVCAQEARARNEEAAVPAIDPKADTLIRQMSDFMAKQSKFQFEGDNSVDVVLEDGQKLQFQIHSEGIVRRPNALKTSRRGAVIDQQIFYDGAKLTLYRKALGYYASVDAPPTIDETLDYAIDELGLVAPGADLLYSDPYQALMQDAQRGYYIGETLVRGVKCHHLAFRASRVDWQIWVEDGETPVPRKFIITAKMTPGAPQFTAEYSGWDFSPDIKNEEFAFVPPEGSYQIGFAPKGQAASTETEGGNP